MPQKNVRLHVARESVCDFDSEFFWVTFCVLVVLVHLLHLVVVECGLWSLNSGLSFLVDLVSDIFDNWCALTSIWRRSGVSLVAVCRGIFMRGIFMGVA